MAQQTLPQERRALATRQSELSLKMILWLAFGLLIPILFITWRAGSKGEAQVPRDILATMQARAARIAASGRRP
ncbi:MAG TPA: hypothetical protein VK499_05030 [Propionibacteriaceae bacterium]|nr:hypothetical protein [Propionibacteriaceae bacterium]